VCTVIGQIIIILFFSQTPMNVSNLFNQIVSEIQSNESVLVSFLSLIGASDVSILKPSLLGLDLRVVITITEVEEHNMEQSLQQNRIYVDGLLLLEALRHISTPAFWYYWFSICAILIDRLGYYLGHQISSSDEKHWCNTGAALQIACFAGDIMIKTRGPRKISGISIFSETFGQKPLLSSQLAGRYDQGFVVGKFFEGLTTQEELLSRARQEKLYASLSFCYYCSPQELNSTALSTYHRFFDSDETQLRLPVFRSRCSKPTREGFLLMEKLAEDDVVAVYDSETGERQIFSRALVPQIRDLINQEGSL